MTVPLLKLGKLLTKATGIESGYEAEALTFDGPLKQATWSTYLDHRLGVLVSALSRICWVDQ